MFYSKNAKNFVLANAKHIVFLTTICSTKKLKRKSIPKHLHGIYILIDAKTGEVLYVGQTQKCVSSRAHCHLKSLSNPFLTNELTGLMFQAANIPLDVEMDLYYIDSKHLDINTRDEYVSVETMFKIALDAKANKFKCRHPKKDKI